MTQPGLGVMIGILGGNQDTVDAVKASIGKTIKSAAIHDDVLSITFTDDTQLQLNDDGQSCCEHRYMVCDDDLTFIPGAILTDIHLRDAPEIVGEYGEVHESQFLVLITDKGSFAVSNHNEHNGYYGGFWLKAKVQSASPSN